MTKADAIDRAGSIKALAELLGITTQAISHWSANVPEAREWQLRLMKPEWFYKAKEKEK